jgi:hypothetical protein
MFKILSRITEIYRTKGLLVLIQASIDNIYFKLS